MSFIQASLSVIHYLLVWGRNIASFIERCPLFGGSGFRCSTVRYYTNLIIAVLEETVEHVFNNILPDLDGVDVDTWNILLDEVHQPTQTKWVTARVTWCLEKGGREGRFYQHKVVCCMV